MVVLKSYNIDIEKVKRSIALIKEFEPYEGYHLAFSGGKDSICIYYLAKIAGVKFDAYYSMTSVDPPDVLTFIKKYFPDVKFLRPKYSMFKLIEFKRFLPTRIMPFCCEHLKEYACKGEFIIQGIRWEESLNRSNKSFYYVDSRKVMGGKKYLNPILDWYDEDVWNFIKKYKLPFPDLYLSCFNRIGCIGCPKAYTKHRQREFLLYPRYKKAYLKAIEKAMLKGGFREFKNSEDVFSWWISGLNVKEWIEKENQMKLNF